MPIDFELFAIKLNDVAMWFNPENGEINWKPAMKHLSRVEPRLAGIIRQVGPCTLQPRRDYFVTLCKSIYSQQLSVKVAATLFGRFRDQFPARRPTPSRVREYLLKEGEAGSRRVGLSRAKASYILDLADHFLSNRIPTRRLSKMSDQEVIDALVEVKGIGRWTAEMFLMFVLNRPDVLPVDDLGLREGVREVFELRKRPTPKEVIDLGEPWKPYRSIATWYIWRRHAVKTSK